MNKRYLISLVAFVLVIAVVASWWFTPSASVASIQALKCDLNQGECKALSAQGQSISLQLTPRPVPILKPIQIEAQLQGFLAKPEQIQVVLEGLNMYMGMQRAWLKPSANNDQYTGTLQIPSCQEHDMQWKVTLLLPPRSSVERAEFFMQTHTE